MVPLALLLYDHALTFGEELRVNQGLSIMQFVYQEDMPGAYAACNIIARLTAVLTTISYLAVGVFSSLRVYAILERNLKLAVLVFALYLMAVGGDAYYNHSGLSTPVAPPLRGCARRAGDEKVTLLYILNLELCTELRACPVSVSAACMLLAETIVQVSTWAKTFKVHQMLRNLNAERSLTRLLLCDGTVAFTLLSFWEILVQIVTYVQLSSVNLPIISVVLCRFLLRLRQIYMSGDSSTSHVIPAAVIGNVGAPLDMRSIVFDTHAAEEDIEGDGIYVSADPLAEGLQLA
ncbi:hypothetical protein NM688_g2103 [Phlebia brevispora]|uniref:Uncharacterized protein n=1 Tax=Phlebia brevispora TaxID=194682 RepID=A0ACC1T9V1_9APHY|nr:hypothetical protein NM688_g2103 [Phlebia brevispora]